MYVVQSHDLILKIGKIHKKEKQEIDRIKTTMKNHSLFKRTGYKRKIGLLLIDTFRRYVNPTIKATQ